MSYSLDISEKAAAAVAAMEEIWHDIFVMTMIDLAADPYAMGYELARQGSISERAVSLESLGTIVYAVDDERSTVSVLYVRWPGPSVP